jgi:hypothetical protein
VGSGDEETECAGISGEAFADVEKALDERTIGHNPERLCLMKVSTSLLLSVLLLPMNHAGKSWWYPQM